MTNAVQSQSNLPAQLELDDVRPGPAGARHGAGNFQQVGIQSLPTELLLYVVDYVLLEDYPEYVMRLRLTHVCQRWRRAILSSPQLWNRIAPRSTTVVKDRQMMTRLDFARAATCPRLDIEIWWRTDAAPFGPEARIDHLLYEVEQYFSEYVSLALSMDVQPRIRSLKFGPVSGRLLNYIEKHPITQLKNVEELVFDPDWFESPHLGTKMWDLLTQVASTSAASLHTLDLFNAKISEFPLLTNLKTFRLKNCKFNSGYETLHTLLHHLPDLEEFRWTDRMAPFPEALLTAGPPLSLTNLRKLALGPVFDDEDSMFLQHLDSPHLDSLHFVRTTGDDGTVGAILPTSAVEAPNLLTTLYRKRWDLVELGLTGILGPEQDISRLLAGQRHSLRRLALFDHQLGALQCTEASSSPLPVEELVLDVRNMEEDALRESLPFSHDGSAATAHGRDHVPTRVEAQEEQENAPAAHSDSLQYAMHATQYGPVNWNHNTETCLSTWSTPVVPRIYLHDNRQEGSWKKEIQKPHREQEWVIRRPVDSSELRCKELYLGHPEWLLL